MDECSYEPSRIWKRMNLLNDILRRNESQNRIDHVYKKAVDRLIALREEERYRIRVFQGVIVCDPNRKSKGV